MQKKYARSKLLSENRNTEYLQQGLFKKEHSKLQESLNKIWLVSNAILINKIAVFLHLPECGKNIT
jgi:hypothetical protein